MFASLPMYDLPEIRTSTDALWRLIKARLADHGFYETPEELTRGSDPHVDWLRKDLALSQTCGLPFVRELQGMVQMLGSPSYDIECGSGCYYSVIVAGKDAQADLDSLCKGTLACNDLRSQSGFAAVLTHLTNEGFGLPSAINISGAHSHSIEMIAKNEADYAAIDAVTWALAKRHLPEASDVRIVGMTAPMPCLPFVTSLQNREHAGLMRQAISEAIAGLSEADREALLLTGFVARQEEDYQPIMEAWDALAEAGLVQEMAARLK